MIDLPVAFKGAPASPYTRKMIALMRYRHIPYRFLVGMAADKAGMPKAAVELLPTFYLPNAEGVLAAVTDSTPLIRRLEQEVSGRSALPPDATWEQALAAIEGVATAIEIVDSRYRDFQFHLPDMVADSASACAFVLGDWRALRADLDLRQLAVALEVDGQAVAAGSTAAILDHPVHALQAAARLAAANGQPLGAGSILMAGSATDPFVLQPGQRVLARIEQLGTVEFSVEPD